MTALRPGRVSGPIKPGLLPTHRPTSPPSSTMAPTQNDTAFSTRVYVSGRATVTATSRRTLAKKRFPVKPPAGRFPRQSDPYP